MKVIGVTGPTGAGKTTVLRPLEELGCMTVDCDALYHRLLDTSPALLTELTDRFGTSILDTGGRLDRKALGAVVFADPNALLDLNAITHRHVRAALEDILEAARRDRLPGLVIDAIALFEGGVAPLCDVTVAVLAPAEVRVRRIMARDDIPEDYARSRVAAQKPDEFYRSGCDHTIVNDGSKTPAELAAEVKELFRPILEPTLKEE